jgi:hypothetical protein
MQEINAIIEKYSINAKAIISSSIEGRIMKIVSAYSHLNGLGFLLSMPADLQKLECSWHRTIE